MKLIDEYLDTLYKKDNNKSTLELKHEMRDHLIESVNDLKLQGLYDEEACKKAIEKFEKIMRAEDKATFNRNTSDIKDILFFERYVSYDLLNLD